MIFDRKKRMLISFGIIFMLSNVGFVLTVQADTAIELDSNCGIVVNKNVTYDDRIELISLLETNENIEVNKNATYDDYIELICLPEKNNSEFSDEQKIEVNKNATYDDDIKLIPLPGKNDSEHSDELDIEVNKNATYDDYIDVMIYEDIAEIDWFYSYVNKTFTTNLMTGLDENAFGPYEILSRAQFATILSRMEESRSVPYDDMFNDVAEGEWYTEAVLWAAENGIVTGYENGCFGPADTITREQMAAMLYRYAEYKGYDTAETTDLTKYPDASDVSNFAEEAMSWCVAKGIISGNDGKLLPQGNTTRAECAAMISRFVYLYE